ncbi:MAG: glycosyltransferase family 2 protein [Dehalococcoidia bacterium]|nr:glycosyltransferase family 2 protein [Dehalococcoidia bacterium]
MTLLLSVVIPTKNEQENVAPLVERLHAALRGLPYEIVFVDDSDDETPQAIRGLAGSYPVRLIARSGKERSGGLAGAVVEGMKRSEGEYICVLDADLQHPPDQIQGLLIKAREGEADMVIASRYRQGGSPEGLDGWRRNAISRACKWLAHVLLLGADRRLSDPLSGFFLVRRSLVASSNLRPIGYKIGLEILVRLQPRQVAEMPYEFAVRQSGRSKASLREGAVFLAHLLRLRREVPRPRSLPQSGSLAVEGKQGSDGAATLSLREYVIAKLKGSTTFVKFAIVGSLGYLVNQFFLFLVYDSPVLWFLPAKGTSVTILFVTYTDVRLLIAIVAGVEAAILSNFFWHNIWTFTDRTERLPMPLRFVTFHLTSIGSPIISGTTVAILAPRFGVNVYLANSLGIALGMFCNWVWNAQVIWRKGKEPL